MLMCVGVHARSLVSIGTVPGGTHSAAYGVSADGQVVAVSATTSLGQRNAYRWTREEGFEQITPDGHDRYPRAISADGSCLVGSEPAPYPMFGFVFDTEHGYSSLDDGPDLLTMPRAVSANGDIVVGQAVFPSDWPNRDGSAFRWQRETATFDDLGRLAGHVVSHATGISADGGVICGASLPERSTDMYMRAVYWTPERGIQELGTFPDHHTSSALAVSPDGSTILGLIVSSENPDAWLWQPVRWRLSNGSSVFEPMTRPPNTRMAAGYATSTDGSITVGVAGYYQDGDLTAVLRAALWTPHIGVVDLNEYLPTIGIDTTGWTLDYATGVSADGRTIVGSGVFNGAPRGFVLTLPPPCGTADFNNDADHGTDADIESFFACLSGNCCPRCPEAGADFNADGDPGSDADIEAFFRVLAGGTC